ncbi:MAG: hypothetical protein H0T91_00890 [Propionibacteriaceae bacterium]|nr:hypothetical protein [Propionibacteriaceae bacterium]
MSELLSMLVPLETLPGWPAVENPTALQTLGLLVGLPVAVMVVVALLVKASSLTGGNRDARGQYTDPVWLGARGAKRELTGADEQSDRPAIESDSAVNPPTRGDRGGASARW